MNNDKRKYEFVNDKYSMNIQFTDAKIKNNIQHVNQIIGSIPKI